MNILVINLHSCQNAGDAALTHETLRQLRRAFPQAHFTLAPNDPQSHRHLEEEEIVGSFMSWVCRLDRERRWRWQILRFPYHFLHSLVAVLTFRLWGRPTYLDRHPDRRRLMQAYFGADLVVSCAGGFLYTTHALAVSFWWSIYSMLFARLSGKPLYMFPQSIGPFATRFHRWGAYFVLNRVRLIVVRDLVSAQAVAAGGFRRPWHLLPDVAFATPTGDKEEAARWLARRGLDPSDNRPRIGVTLMNWGAQSRLFAAQSTYEEAMVSLVQEATHRLGAQVVLFSQVVGPSASEDDGIIARRIYDRLQDGSSIVLADGQLPPEQLKAAYGLMDFFVGTRMHSNILALSAGVPTLAIGYLTKTRGIMEMLGLGEWVCDIGHIEPSGLVTLFRRAWSQRQIIGRQLQEVMPRIQEEAQHAGALIAADWQTFSPG